MPYSVYIRSMPCIGLKLIQLTAHKVAHLLAICNAKCIYGKNAPPTALKLLWCLYKDSVDGEQYMPFFSERKTESAANRNVHQQMKLSENVI